MNNLRSASGTGHATPSWKMKWQIWTVQFDYEDTVGSKIRPSILAGRDASDSNFWNVIYITSQVDKNWYDDYYRLKYWQEAGLDRQSAVRACKAQRVNESKLIRYVGRLHPTDIKGVLVACG